MAWFNCPMEWIGKLRHERSKGLCGASDGQGAPVISKPNL